MTKNELIAFMSEKAGLKKTEAAKALEAVFEGITETLKKGQKVQIVGFGTFETRERAARVGRNPQNASETIQIPAKTVPTFKAGKLLRDAVEALPVSAAPAPKAAEKPAEKPALKAAKSKKKK